MGIRKCPQQLTQCEGSQCQEIRNQIASSEFDDFTNLGYKYTPVNTPFEIADNYCLGIGGRLANLNQLNQLAHMFTYFDENVKVHKCPTLVWGKDEDGNPVIVRIQPCIGDKIEVIRDFNIKICMAHVLCTYD